MVYIVRNATTGDLAEMIRLERLSLTAAHWTEQQYRALFGEMAPARLALIAQPAEGGYMAGFLIARHLHLEWELENIVVAEKRRSQGIGTQLMRALLAHVQSTNDESVFLEVRESNKPARALYEKLGFQETGRRKSYYTGPLEDAVLYTLHPGRAGLQIPLP